MSLRIRLNVFRLCVVSCHKLDMEWMPLSTVLTSCNVLTLQSVVAIVPCASEINDRCFLVYLPCESVKQILDIGRCSRHSCFDCQVEDMPEATNQVTPITYTS